MLFLLFIVYQIKNYVFVDFVNSESLAFIDDKAKLEDRVIVKSLVAINFV